MLRFELALIRLYTQGAIVQASDRSNASKALR
jgi:hypothetical protein